MKLRLEFGLLAPDIGAQLTAQGVHSVPDDILIIWEGHARSLSRLRAARLITSRTRDAIERKLAVKIAKYIQSMEDKSNAGT